MCRSCFHTRRWTHSLKFQSIAELRLSSVISFLALTDHLKCLSNMSPYIPLLTAPHPPCTHVHSHIHPKRPMPHPVGHSQSAHAMTSEWRWILLFALCSALFTYFSLYFCPLSLPALLRYRPLWLSNVPLMCRLTHQQIYNFFIVEATSYVIPPNIKNVALAEHKCGTDVTKPGNAYWLSDCCKPIVSP